MINKKLLSISFLTILFLAVFQYLAIKYYWYWTYRWLDIPVHIIGGFWVSITTLWVALRIKHIDSIFGYKKKALFLMLITVLTIALLWEIFELFFSITSLNSVGYWGDSLGDVANSFVGGIIAFLYFIRNKKAKNCLIIESVFIAKIPLENNNI